MSDLNHLFTDFPTLFDTNASGADKAKVRAVIQDKVENNMDLINRVAKESNVKASTTNVIFL